MKCTYCGHENSDETNFCENCGAQLKKPEAPKAPQPQAPAAAAAPSAPQPAGAPAAAASAESFAVKAKAGIAKIPKMYLYIGIGVVALLLIIILCVNLFKPAKYPSIALEYSFFNDEDGQAQVYLNGKALGNAMDAKLSSVYYNTDRTVAAFTDSEKNLYVLNKSGYTSVAENVTKFAISGDGTSVAFLDADGVFNLYTIKTKATEMIAEDLASVQMSLSPDGKCVIYSMADPDNNETNLYLYTAKKSTKVGKGLLPVGLTNNAQYIYAYSSENSALYVTNKGGDKTKLAADVSSSSVLLNKDHTQIIFIADNKAYISTKGAEKVKLASSCSSLSMLLPRNCPLSYTYAGTVGTVTYPLSQLLNQTFVIYDGSSAGPDISYINKKGEANKVASNVSEARLTSDGKTVLYIKAENIYKKAVTSTDSSTKIAEDAITFTATKNGGAVYFINTDDELMYVKGTGKAKKIADDVSSMSITMEDQLIFMADYADYDGVLYSSKNGSEKKKISDTVASYQVNCHAVYYRIDYDQTAKTATLYVLNGTKGTKLMENVLVG